jgi:hypothetical protein
MGEVEHWQEPRVVELRTRRQYPLDTLAEGEHRLACRGDRAYASFDKAVVAWDLTTGERLWQQVLQREWITTIEPHEDLVLVRWKFGLFVLDARTGEEAGRYTLDTDQWSFERRGEWLCVGHGRKVQRLRFPSLEETSSISMSGLLAWSLRPDGSILTANHSQVTHWNALGEVERSWPQKRSGMKLLFHPRVPALVALGDRFLEWFHPGSEQPDQRVPVHPSRRSASFVHDRLVLTHEQGLELYRVQTELRLAEMRPGDLERLESSPALWARFVKAALRYRYRNEVGLGDFEFPDGIMLDPE